MKNFEIFLASHQPDGFVVSAKTVEEAVHKTVDHARKKYPGVFDADGNIKEYGYPLVYEIGQWQ